MNESNTETFYKKVREKSLLILSWLVLLLGLLLTLFVSYRVKTDIELHERQKFELRCEEVKLKIQARLAAQKQILLSGAAMFDASEDVTRKEWRVYVRRLSFDQHFNGIQALGFSLWIKPEQLKAHENSLRQSGFPDYRVKPEGKRDAYTSIIYIEPFSGRNLRAFGYDMYSEPIRRAAMDYAVDSQNVSLSGKVTLLQEESTNVQAGTLMYAPVYQKNKPIDTREQRRAALFGWVYSPFRMTDLFKNIVSDGNIETISHLHLHIYDGDKIQPENLLYQSENHLLNNPAPLFSLETQMALFGTLWTLRFEEFTGVEKNVDYGKVWITTSAGVFISLLLFFLLRTYFLMRTNALKIAFELTTQLRKSEEKLALTNADLLQFTNISAHHLQEPARRLVSFVQRLQHELITTFAPNEDAAITLHFIEQSALRQRALVRDIQLYLAATQPRATVESVSVTEIIAKVVEHHAPLILEVYAQIDYVALPTVTIDRPRLYDIFDILLDNALRYRVPNRIPKIRIYGELKGKRIRYYVEDNGVGIPTQYRERVFLVFERLQVNDNQESTGIGLAIVRRVIESCGGSVSLKETNGGGTTVVFDLPTGN